MSEVEAVVSEYILVDGEPQRCEDLLAWGRWFTTADRGVAKTAVDDANVSTVFLGLDHGDRMGGAPILWETMIFGGPQDGYQRRYTSRAAALKGHERAVRMARGGDPTQEKPCAT